VRVLVAIDTSGKNGSLALARTPAPDAPLVEVLEVVPLAGGTFSAQLVPQIADLLERHRFSKSDIDGFVVVSGPGSFTGLRVGLAAIKALAEVLNKPIAAVSLLEVIAMISKQAGRVTTALEAGRGDVYVGVYEVNAPAAAGVNSVATRVEERLLSREEFVELSKTSPIVSPDVTLAELARRNGGSADQVPYPDSGIIARIGWPKLLTGQTVSPLELDANYIRRSDAEIFSKPK
jgi:tRNA threonylcarbamoyladenosine biosynthesis protein TsaB